MKRMPLRIIFWAATWGVALGLPLGAQEQSQQRALSPQEFRAIADQLYERQRYEEARDIYLRILPEFPKDAGLLRNLGWSFYRARRSDPREAIHYWSLSWQIEDNESLKEQAARVYAQIGEWEEGAKLLQELAENHPQHPQHWRDLATLAESANQYGQAIGWYRNYLERRAGDRSAHLELAKLLGWDKQYAEAATEYNVIIQSEPRNLPARLGMARVLSWQGQLEASLRMYEALLSEQPANREAQKGKAFVLLWMGRAQEAKPIFQALSRRYPQDQEISGALQEIARLEATGAPPTPALPDPVRELRSRAEQAMRENDAPGAVALLQQAVQLAPQDTDLQRRLAQAHLAAGELDSVLSLLEVLRSKDPENTAVLRDLATTQVRLGRLSEAADTLRAYLERKPDDREARLELARMLNWSRRFEEASAVFHQILQMDPENLPSRVGLAQIDLWQGRSDEALQQLEAILRQDPTQREALLGKSQALYGLGRTEESLRLLEELQQRFPQDREITTALEGIRGAEQQRAALQTPVPADTDTQIRHYQQVLEQDPNNFEALRTLGDLYTQKNDLSPAASYYRKAHEQRPEDREVHLKVARVLSWVQEYQESAQLYRGLVQAEPNPDYLLELARVLSWSGSTNESVEVYERLLQLQPQHLEARLGLARVLSWSRNYEQSLQNYRLVLDQDPQNRETRIELARVTAWKGDLARSIELYNELQQAYPDDRDVLLGEAQALQWSGRTREARGLLEQLRTQHPTDQEVLLAMASTQLALGRRDLALRDLDRVETLNPDNRDLQVMRSLILRQLRPTLVLGFSPSFDSDDLKILPYTGTLYFSMTPRIRSYLRGAVTSSMLPGSGIFQGREAFFGSTIQAASWLILRGEAGGNSASTGRSKPIGGGGLTLLPGDRTRLDFDASREFINYLPRPVALNISRLRMRTALNIQPWNRFLIRMDYEHSRYSDTNRSHSANFNPLLTLLRSEHATLEGGYLYAISLFEKPIISSGYFAPSQLQRHAGQFNLYGQLGSRVGYSFTGTLGAERVNPDNFRLDGTLRATTDFTLAEHLKMSLGYGFFRIASVARSAAYRTHSVSIAFEIRF